MFDLEPFKELYPFESRYLDLGGLRYHYLDEGRGNPVVMVHGNPTWSFHFRELVKDLRDDCRCIVPDHIGCGLSDKPGDDRYDYTLSRRVDDLEILLDRLGAVGGVTLVLHDWGGMIGMAWAMRHLERVSRLVLMNTAAFLKPPGKRMPLALAIFHRRNWLSTLLAQGLNLFSLGAAMFGTAKGLPPRVRRGLMAPYDSWADRIATLRFVQDAPLRRSDRSFRLAMSVDDGLGRFAGLPTLICWGERDFVFDRLFLEEWRRRFPAAEVHAFADAGHYVLEDAADRIVPLVRDFFRRHPPVAARALARPEGGQGSCRRCENPLSHPAPRESLSAPVASAPRSRRGTREDIATAENTVINVARYLPEAARLAPDRPAVMWATGRNAAGAAHYEQWTFRELDQESDRYARGLERAGIGRGTRTILMVRPGPELFALVFALFKIGAVPVLIDPGMGRRWMAECLARVTAEAFIGVPSAHLLPVLHPGAFASVGIRVTVGRRWLGGGLALKNVRAEPWRPYEPAATRAGDPAAIIFTTGSTGPPKGVVYRHGMFDAQVRALREHLGIEPGEIDLPTFPLFALFDPAMGMTAVVPDMDPTRPAWVDAEKIVRAVRERGVTNMFGSPALLERVGRYGAEHGVKLPSLRRVVSAGAPASPAALERFSGMLTGAAEIHTPYGATEALPVASIGSREILGETSDESRQGRGTCVGRPLPGVEVRVIRISDEPIERWTDVLAAPAGEIGEIVVRGPAVSWEYFKDGAATRLAKIREAGTIWHRMGDVGRLDGRGRLWFCGRKSHRVITEQGALFTVPCEAIFNQHPKVFRSALVGVGKPPRQRPVICIELEAAHRNADRERLRTELLDLGRRHSLTAAIETVLFHPAFPVDIRHNAKIFREKLAAWAEHECA